MQITTPMGHTLKYTLSIDGTAYSASTAPELVEILEAARLWRDRVRITLAMGDVETGYIVRDSGRIKRPLIQSNANSLGGAMLADDQIVKVEHANQKDGGTIWEA